MSIKKIRLRCNKCNGGFVLGENGMIMTTTQLLGDLGILTRELLAKGFVANKDDPDLVDHAPGHNLSNLEWETHKVQMKQLAMVKSALEVGCRRFWKCGKCGQVQEYTYPMGKTARALLILSILTPLLLVAWLLPNEFFGPWLRSGFSLVAAVLAVFLGYFVLPDKIDEWLFYR